MNPGATTRPSTSRIRSTPASSERTEVADGQDPVAEHADVGRPPRRAGPVDEKPAAQDEVEGGHCPDDAIGD